MRFVGTCYRAHDPRWAFKPMSGEGVAIRGARFNPKGVPALYLGLSIMTVIKEANQGFARRIDPCVLCSYEIDCEDVADLTTAQARKETVETLGPVGAMASEEATNGLRDRTLMGEAEEIVEGIKKIAAERGRGVTR